MRALIISGVSLILVQACATTDRGQRVVGESATDRASSAAMLEVLSEDAEAKLQRSGNRINDPVLERYVQGITSKLAGNFAQEVRVYLLEAPVFNAFMMPNGAMGVNSGLMLRVETEDELAAVLGHEFGHYLEKHSEERHASASNTNTAIRMFSLASAGASAATGSYIGTSNAALIMIAGYYSFNRGQELEADQIGIETARTKGYSPAGAVAMWENIEREKQSSSIKAVRNRHSSIYDTHPTSQVRIEKLKTLAGLDGEVPRSDTQSRKLYRERIRPYLLPWLEDEIALRDPGATLNLIDRLDDLGEDMGTLLYARARVIDRALTNRKLKKDKTTRKIVASFSETIVVDTLAKAVTHADAPAVAYREYGNALLKAGQKGPAAEALKNYLSAAPNANDVQLIRSMIQQIES